MPEKKHNINEVGEMPGKCYCSVEERVDKDEQIRRLQRDIEWMHRDNRNDMEFKQELTQHIDSLVTLLSSREYRCRDLKNEITLINNAMDDLQTLCGKVHSLCSETYRYDDKASKPVKAFAKKVLDILERR